MILFSFKGVSQSYTVAPIPYQQYTGSLLPLATFDDFYSPLIALPFDFQFYGVTYNQLVISTNGFIDFRPEEAGTTSSWTIASTMTLPSTTFNVKNAIFGAYHDMNNSNGQGTITYGVSGTAPYRKFVVFFDNNSHFGPCVTTKSTFQMILNETNSTIDIQLIDKQACTLWQNGNCVTGIINLTGDRGIAAPNRNNGSWAAFHEGWRFKPQTTASNTYSFIKCDENLDGFETYDLTVVNNDLNASLAFYTTQADALAMTNQLSSTSYTNSTPNTQTIYARVLGTTLIYDIILSMVDCSIDFDNDTVPAATEDLNADTNLANDDTDADDLANFNDNDDDGDLVLTNLEYVFPRNSALLDSDNDGILNYIDNDDDGDGVLTINEDANGNNNPADDDADGDGIPNFLENSSLSNQDFATQNNITIYPNPASDILTINNKTQEAITNVSIFSIKGDLVKQSKSNTIVVSELQSGVYFVKIEMNKTVLNYKFIKN